MSPLKKFLVDIGEPTVLNRKMDLTPPVKLEMGEPTVLNRKMDLTPPVQTEVGDIQITRQLPEMVIDLDVEPSVEEKLAALNMFKR